MRRKYMTAGVAHRGTGELLCHPLIIAEKCVRELAEQDRMLARSKNADTLSAAKIMQRQAACVLCEAANRLIKMVQDENYSTISE